MNKLKYIISALETISKGVCGHREECNCQKIAMEALAKYQAQSAIEKNIFKEQS